jgi:hypothetical protein
MWVSVLRVFATSLILGQFLSPAFMLSLIGSMLSLGTITYLGSISDTASAVVIDQYPLTADTLVKVKLGTPINITISNKPKN